MIMHQTSTASTMIASLILASASPRRAELLKLLMPEFTVQPADIDERVHSTELPEHYVVRMAESKARAIVSAQPEAGEAIAVLGSDTVVVLEKECLGKPADQAQAAEMLRRLSNRSHRVMTAVCLIEPCQSMKTAVSITEVHFAKLPEHWIERYVASGEPMDKAGAYAIQGQASAWIEFIHGSYSGVMGLPLFETAQQLRAARLID